MTEAYSGNRGPEEESNSAENDSQLSEEERLRRLTGDDSREWFDEFGNLMESLGFYGAPEQVEQAQDEPPRPFDEDMSE